MKPIFYLILFLSFPFAKLLHPINNFEIESLSLNNKEVDYYILRGEECSYEIEGPKLVNFYFRKPVPKKNITPVDVSIHLKLNDTESLKFTEVLLISNNTHSKKHPAHSFSNAGKIQVNIPSGIHQLFINSEELPLLIRLTHQKKPKRKKSDISEIDINQNQILNVITGNRSVSYSKLETQNEALFRFSENQKGDFWIYSRGIYNNEEDFYQPYILNFKENNKSISSIFYSFFSNQSKIQDTDGIPGKLRTSHFYINNKDSEVLVLNNSIDRNVLIRGEFIPK
jgi:hypothetical protein